MTLDEAQAKIKELEGQITTKDTEIATANGKITKLNTENAERRVINAQQKKTLHNATQVLKKNNIKVDINTMNTENLTLNTETGQVEGEVIYNPASIPEIGGGVPPTSNDALPAMTVESIQGMSRSDIAKNWDAVSSVLTAQGEQPNNNIN